MQFPQIQNTEIQLGQGQRCQLPASQYHSTSIIVHYADWSFKATVVYACGQAINDQIWLSSIHYPLTSWLCSASKGLILNPADHNITLEPQNDTVAVNKVLVKVAVLTFREALRVSWHKSIAWHLRQAKQELQRKSISWKLALTQCSPGCLALRPDAHRAPQNSAL